MRYLKTNDGRYVAARYIESFMIKNGTVYANTPYDSYPLKKLDNPDDAPAYLERLMQSLNKNGGRQ